MKIDSDLARKDRPTGDRCMRTLRDLSVRGGERICGEMTHRVEVMIPALVTVIVCPTCDVVNVS